MYDGTEYLDVCPTCAGYVLEGVVKVNANLVTVECACQDCGYIFKIEGKVMVWMVK